jgi:hypothetical protein
VEERRFERRVSWAEWSGRHGWLKNSDSAATRAKALTEKTDFIAALEALRHPEASFSAKCEAPVV